MEIKYTYEEYQLQEAHRIINNGIRDKHFRKKVIDSINDNYNKETSLEPFIVRSVINSVLDTHRIHI